MRMKRKREGMRNLLKSRSSVHCGTMPNVIVGCNKDSTVGHILYCIKANTLVMVVTVRLKSTQPCSNSKLRVV